MFYPLFPTNPSLKVKDLSSPSHLKNLVGGWTLSPPPAEKQGCTLWYNMFIIALTSMFKKTKTTLYKIWNFYFAQILAGTIEKQHVLTPFNFFLKFSHCLASFPIFSVDVNWIFFYITAHLLKILLWTDIIQNVW